MIDHDDAEAYALGALDAVEEAAFERHLAECAQCRAAVASYAPVMQAMRSLPASAPPPMPVVRRRTYWREAIAAVLLIGVGASSATLVRHSDADLAALGAMVADRPVQVALTGPRAHGSVVVGDAHRRTAVVVDGLPPAPNGSGYQVWVRGRGISSPGMLHRTREGLEILIVPGDLVTGAHHIGVTVEPASGSPKRTGDVQVEADV
ncbi:MAG: anti-sigma factor [Candidatus Velthaea sp.]